MYLIRLHKLKKRLIICLLGYLVIFALLAVIVNYLGNIKSKILLQRQLITRDINFFNNNIIEFQKKIQEVKEAQELWENLNKGGRKREGLQLDEASLFIDHLKQRFEKISKIDIDLSPPEELDNAYKTASTVIMSSTVTLRVSALTDDIIFSIINNVINNFPGFININSFSIDRRADITNENLKQIRAGNFPDLVYAEMIFAWRDFKDIDNGEK